MSVDNIEFENTDSDSLPLVQENKISTGIEFFGRLQVFLGQHPYRT